MQSRRSFLLQTAVTTAVVTTVFNHSRSVAQETLSQSGTLKSTRIPHTDLVVSRIAYGCNLTGTDPESTEFAPALTKAVRAAFANGITLFDLADAYGDGRSEAVLGDLLKSSRGLRHKMVLQTKCGQIYARDPAKRLAGVDLTREHIVRSAEQSLMRLGIDYLDILLLHQFDPLSEPDEIARAFEELKRGGKVRYFGVSNHTAEQIDLLQKAVKEHLVINQINLGLGRLFPRFAYPFGPQYLGSSGLVEYCQSHGIQVQAWSPVRGALLSPPPDSAEEIKRTAHVLADIAAKKSTSPAVIALAWLLRHAAGIVPVIGSAKPDHIAEDCTADRVELSREEWYALFAAASAIQS